MLGLREILLNTPTFPYLWVPHCILMNIALRATLGTCFAAVCQLFVQLSVVDQCSRPGAG
jgi:hypothetical protein